MDKTEARVKLAIDAMGSDLGPSEVLEGVSQAINLAPRSTEFLLFGQEEILEPIISKHATLSQAKIELIHCPEVVGMEEKPIAGIKGKKNLQCHYHYKLLKTGMPMQC